MANKDIITVELKEVCIGNSEVKLNYLATFRDFIQTPKNPQQGVNIAEMRESLDVLNALPEEAEPGTKITLTRAQLSAIAERLNNGMFRITSREIVEMVDYVDGLLKA